MGACHQIFAVLHLTGILITLMTSAIIMLERFYNNAFKEKLFPYSCFSVCDVRNFCDEMA